MAELVWKRFNTQDVRNQLDDLSTNTVSRTNNGLSFSKWFDYQDPNLDNVHNSADEIEKLCHDRMEKFLWKTQMKKK